MRTTSAAPGTEVDAVIKRVGTDLRGSRDRPGDVSRISIDEIAYRKGHRYMTVVVHHDTGDIIWAKPGRDTATVTAFFEELGEQRTAKLTHISSDAVADNAAHATLCMDTFRPHAMLRIISHGGTPSHAMGLPDGR